MPAFFVAGVDPAAILPARATARHRWPISLECSAFLYATRYLAAPSPASPIGLAAQQPAVEWQLRMLRVLPLVAHPALLPVIEPLRQSPRNPLGQPPAPGRAASPFAPPALLPTLLPPALVSERQVANAPLPPPLAPRRRPLSHHAARATPAPPACAPPPLCRQDPAACAAPSAAGSARHPIEAQHRAAACRCGKPSS